MILCATVRILVFLEVLLFSSLPLFVLRGKTIICNLNTFLENAFHMEKWLRDESNYICEGHEWLSV